jgi:hypothetical protein
MAIFDAINRVPRLISHIFSNKGKNDGNPNPVLNSLGIDKNVSIKICAIKLVKMTLAHTLLALFGLIINSRHD